MAWPNVAFWSALRSGPVTAGGQRMTLATIDCGALVMPTGRLVACDPFTSLDGATWVQVPPGRHGVVVTLADVSELQDGSHIREAYATLLLGDPASGVRRAIVTPVAGAAGAAVPPEMEADGGYWGFGVDTGTACFADAHAIATCMPQEADWLAEFFDSGRPDSWFSRMDDPAHIRAGIANIELPGGCGDWNIVLFHSGWGDGLFPLIAEYDAEGALVAMHIDFMVVWDEAAARP